MSDRSERAFFVAGTSTNAHHTSGSLYSASACGTDRSAGRGVVFFFASRNIVMFWNASLRTVTHFRRCSQTSLLCTRRHANRILTAERFRGADFIGAWKRAVARDVEVTTLTECNVYGSVLGSGWLRGEGEGGLRSSERVAQTPRAHDIALVFFIATFSPDGLPKKALSFS